MVIARQSKGSGQTLMTACNIVHKVVQSLTPKGGKHRRGQDNTSWSKA